MTEHPVQQQIDGIVLDAIESSQEAFWVGRSGVTWIEATTKSGMHADIPYVRVWSGETCLAEFCQHNIVGVYFAKAVTP